MLGTIVVATMEAVLAALQDEPAGGFGLTAGFKEGYAIS
jgi:hypothetical protein